MKKVLLILITLISVCAQGQTYKISQLAGTKWILCVGDTSRVKRVWDFSDKTLKTSTSFKSINKSNNFTYNYYLSVSPTETFSSGLIGKDTKGEYIVLQKRDGIECMKIENLTDHTLKVVIEASKETNRNGNSSAIFILKRIR
ncbi:MAG: hypothetical protein IJ610_04350 [Bacteroidaceae bacterium]|nr:hypothetical protein [Bacteroidaceae bacterium]